PIAFDQIVSRFSIENKCDIADNSPSMVYSYIPILLGDIPLYNRGVWITVLPLITPFKSTFLDSILKNWPNQIDFIRLRGTKTVIGEWCVHSKGFYRSKLRKTACKR